MTGKATIHDVAQRAGVSIATVSHVINQTRYVSPDLVERVEEAMRETGYIRKVQDRERRLKTGRNSQIVAVFPNLDGTIYRDMLLALKKRLSPHGYQFLAAVTDEEKTDEQQILESLITDRQVAGILLVPVSEKASDYRKLIHSGKPFICMERNMLGDGIDSVEFRDREAMEEGVDYLVQCRHKNILFLRESNESTTREERTKGFARAVEKNGISENDVNIVDIDLKREDEYCQLMIEKAINKLMPTAVISGSNRLTLHLLRALRNLGIRYPDEISVLGFGEEPWMSLVEPPLTTLVRDVRGLSNLAADVLMEKINTGMIITRERYAGVELDVRKSVRILDNGPYGEEAASPETISLTKEERKKLRTGKYRVAISFHYTGTAWAELHEKGIRDELEKYGIEVISVMDAHFDPDLQNVQLDSIRLQKPDAVIAIPVDDKLTADKFAELSKVTKLVFISNVPENMSTNSYVSCISVNEEENGSNTGRMIGEHFKGRKSVKVALLNHGAIFYGTRARDSAVEQVLKENYKNIEIVLTRRFGKIENAYQVCKEMVKAHPEIQALYVSWDQPALHAIRALRELEREDIAVFTTDLDTGIAHAMEEGIVRGLSTQRPYEQGQAAALAAAKSLVSDTVPKYVGVRPYTVEAKELKRAWKEIFHDTLPADFT